MRALWSSGNKAIMVEKKKKIYSIFLIVILVFSTFIIILPITEEFSSVTAASVLTHELCTDFQHGTFDNTVLTQIDETPFITIDLSERGTWADLTPEKKPKRYPFYRY